LGAFPSSKQETEAAARSPHLAPHHPRHFSEHQGAGVVLAPDGLILTTYHLVKDARKIYVLCGGGQGAYANIHAADAGCGWAVLQVIASPNNLVPVTLGNADELPPGQTLLALAYPPALGQRVEALSATGTILGRQSLVQLHPNPDSRKLALLHRLPLVHTSIRLPASVEGAALFNLSGDLLGMSSGMLDASETITALPINTMSRRLIAVLQKGAEIDYGFLGVNTEDVSAEELLAQGIAGGAVRISEEVTPGTPAAKALLRKGDVILHVDGTRVLDGHHLSVAVNTALAGSVVDVGILRDRRRLTVRVQLAKMGGNEGAIASQPRPSRYGLRVDYASVLLGQVPANRVDLQERALAALRHGGVLVTEVAPASAAERAGLRQHDLITHVNDQPVTTPAEFFREAQHAAGRVVLTLPPLEPRGQPRKLRLE
jgi:serine protease Do